MTDVQKPNIRELLENAVENNVNKKLQPLLDAIHDMQTSSQTLERRVQRLEVEHEWCVQKVTNVLKGGLCAIALLAAYSLVKKLRNK